jgi:hypothetical protein
MLVTQRPELAFTDLVVLALSAVGMCVMCPCHRSLNFPEIFLPVIYRDILNCQSLSSGSGNNPSPKTTD